MQDPALASLVVALARDPVPAVVCDAAGRILWQNEAVGAPGKAATLAQVAQTGTGDVTTELGPCQVSDVPGEGGLLLVRGPFDDQVWRLRGFLHDLRIPLQSLASAAEGAREGSAEDAQRIGRVTQGVLERLETILGELAGGAGVQRDFVADEILERLVDLLLPLAAAGGTGVTIAPAAAATVMHGDPADFSAVVQNVVGNAIKYAPGGHVEASLAPNGDGVLFRVRDDGPGLPPFIRRFLEAGEEPEPGRHIHGLRIVRERLARLGGTLTLGEAEAGTLVMIRIPGAAQEQASLADQTVLIVEDNPVNAEIFAGMVRSMGAVPRVASSGGQGLDVLEEGRFSAVLLDVSLPDMDGLEVSRRIRRLHPACPILGITGHAGPGMHQACLDAGMTQVLVKPVRAAELRMELSRLACPGAPLIDRDAARELAEDVGAEAVFGFQRRALREAEAVAAALAAGGEAVPALVHSAIGAAGMTGLSALERELRRHEHRTDPLPGPEARRLAALLERTRARLDDGA